MRINYSDDEDFPGQYELWRANVERSLAGRKGQVALRELEAALTALPKKELIDGQLEDCEGNVCALGAVFRARGLATKEFRPVVEFEHTEDKEIYRANDAAIKALGIPRLVGLEIIYQNDDGWFTPNPAIRYERVLAWVRQQIQHGANDGRVGKEQTNGM